MYYSDSRFVCNSPNCEIRTRDNPLLQFQTLIKDKLVILGFHQDCGLPRNAQKCQMLNCEIYLDSLYLSKINRKNIGYCSSHNYKISSLWEYFNSLSEEEKMNYERQFFDKLERAHDEKELEDDEFDSNNEYDSEYTNINFDTFRDELTNNLRKLNDPLLNHLDENMKSLHEKQEREEALLKAYQYAEDIRRGLRQNRMMMHII